MSLLNDIVSFWFLGYRGDIRIKLQAAVMNVDLVPIILAFIFSLKSPHDPISAHPV